MKHTPGPWHDVEQVKANARLIAAAPDLLEALQRIAAGEVMTGNFNHAETVHEYQKLAHAAIQKATGEQNG